MMLVVPPQAAARVPVSNVSDASVPPNGICMWVCASMPPGMTYLPVASTTESTDDRRSVPEQLRARREDGRDRLAVDEHVGGRRPGRVDDGSAGDQGRGHGFTVLV